MSNIVEFDSSINSFLTKIINTKNNQTKEDIISGKIKFPNYTSIQKEKTSFKNEENILLKNKLLRKYKISLYVEERAKLERNIYNYENQIMNLRNIKKIDDSQMEEKLINLYQSTKLPTTQLLNKKPSKKKIVYKLKSSIINNEINKDNNNELSSEKQVITNYQTSNNNNEYILKNSKRVQSGYGINNNENEYKRSNKKQLTNHQINDNYQYKLKYEKRSSSDFHNIIDHKIYNKNNNNYNKLYNNYNNSFNRISNNKLYNNLNKSVQFQRNAKEILQIDKYKTEYIKSLSSTIQKDILKLNKVETDYKLTLNAKAFIRRLNADKSQQDILRRKRKINEYNKQLDKDLQNYYDKKKQAEINHDLIHSMENDLKEIKYKYFGKKYINKKYHYYTPASSRMKHGTNQLRNQLKDYSENTRNLAHEYPSIQKYKFLNIETYDNYPIKYREDEIPFNEKLNNNKYDENVDYNEFPSMLENPNRKSPYYFNEPKYNVTLEKRIEEIKHEFDTNRKPPVPKANTKIEKKNNDNNIKEINNNDNLDIKYYINEDKITNKINENNNFDNIINDNENQNDMNYHNIKESSIKTDNYNINNDDNIDNTLMEGGGIITNDDE